MHSIEYNLRRRLSDWIRPESPLLSELQAAQADRLTAETRSLLHKLRSDARWPDYNKSDWMRLQYLLEDAADLRAAFARESHLRVYERLLGDA